MQRGGNLWHLRQNRMEEEEDEVCEGSRSNSCTFGGKLGWLGKEDRVVCAWLGSAVDGTQRKAKSWRGTAAAPKSQALPTVLKCSQVLLRALVLWSLILGGKMRGVQNSYGRQTYTQVNSASACMCMCACACPCVCLLRTHMYDRERNKENETKKKGKVKSTPRHWGLQLFKKHPINTYYKIIYRFTNQSINIKLYIIIKAFNQSEVLSLRSN